MNKKNEIIRKTFAYLKQADILDKVSVMVRFNLKGNTAGAVHHSDGRRDVVFEYNMDIAEANWDTFEETIVHEVAHVVDFVHNDFKTRRFPDGTKNEHGSHWQCIMMDLGVKNPRAFHKYNIVEKPNAVDISSSDDN